MMVVAALGEIHFHLLIEFRLKFIFYFTFGCISMTVVAALGHGEIYFNFISSFVDIEFFFHFWLYFNPSLILTFNMVLLLHSIYFKFSFHFTLIFHISVFLFFTSINTCSTKIFELFIDSSRPPYMSLYYSLVYPYLTYCNMAWSSTYCSNLNCIYLLQKRIVRLLAKADYLANTASLFCQLRRLDIFSIHSFSIAIFMYLSHHSFLPVTFQ